MGERRRKRVDGGRKHTGHKRKRGNYTHGKSLDSRGWREKGKERVGGRRTEKTRVRKDM